MNIARAFDFTRIGKIQFNTWDYELYKAHAVCIIFFIFNHFNVISAIKIWVLQPVTSVGIPIHFMKSNRKRFAKNTTSHTFTRDRSRYVRFRTRFDVEDENKWLNRRNLSRFYRQSLIWGSSAFIIVGYYILSRLTMKRASSILNLYFTYSFRTDIHVV